MNELIRRPLRGFGKDDKIRTISRALERRSREGSAKTREITEGEAMFFYAGGTYVTLIGPYGGIESCKVGYSWTSLLFWWFTPLLKGDWLFGVLYMLAVYLTRGLIQLIVPFFYNRYHIMKRLSQGWRPARAEDAEILRARWFKVRDDGTDGVFSGGAGGEESGRWSGAGARSAEAGSGFRRDEEAVVDDPYEETENWEDEKEQAIDAEFEDE